MPTFVLRDGQFVDKQFAAPLIHILGEAPFVISDNMSETRHMANNKFYTSKSEFRKATRAAGCLEVGNETETLLKPRKPISMSRTKRRDDIRKTISQLKNGSRP